jgi:hypothetical protein
MLMSSTSNRVPKANWTGANCRSDYAPIRVSQHLFFNRWVHGARDEAAWSVHTPLNPVRNPDCGSPRRHRLGHLRSSLRPSWLILSQQKCPSLTRSSMTIRCKFSPLIRLRMIVERPSQRKSCLLTRMGHSRSARQATLWGRLPKFLDIRR